MRGKYFFIPALVFILCAVFTVAEAQEPMEPAVETKADDPQTEQDREDNQVSDVAKEPEQKELTGAEKFKAYVDSLNLVGIVSSGEDEIAVIRFKDFTQEWFRLNECIEGTDICIRRISEEGVLLVKKEIPEGESREDYQVLLEI